MTESVLWLFLTVPWVGLQCVVVVIPDHIHLFFAIYRTSMCHIKAGSTQKRRKKEVPYDFAKGVSFNIF